MSDSISTAAHLVVTKRMQFIQGKTRACVHVQAVVNDAMREKLEEYFVNEALFKRAAYANNWPDGAIPIPAAIAPALSQLLKSDACPEITVKTMLAGQMYQGTGSADMQSFELVAKLSFDNMMAIIMNIAEFDRPIVYCGAGRNEDMAAFEADTAAEMNDAAKAAA